MDKIDFLEMAHKRCMSSALIISLLIGSTAHAGAQQALAAYKQQNYPIAMHEWLPMAEQGDAFAQYALGMLFVNGQGVHQDYKTAIDWYRKAAEQGNAAAQYNLGLLYDNGLGVPQSRVIAHALCSLATRHPEPIRIGKRQCKLINYMSTEQIAASRTLANSLMRHGNFLKALDQATTQVTEHWPG